MLSVIAMAVTYGVIGTVIGFKYWFIHMLMNPHNYPSSLLIQAIGVGLFWPVSVVVVLLMVLYHRIADRRTTLAAQSERAGIPIEVVVVSIGAMVALASAILK